MKNVNPSPFVGKDGGTNPEHFAVLAGLDGSNNPDPLKTDGTGKLLTSVSGAGSGGTSATDDAAFTAGTDAGTPIMGFATSDAVNAGDVGVLAMDTNRNLKVSIEADNAGIGGGIQYTEGDTDASITGTAILWEDSLDTLQAVSASKPLPVDLQDSTVAVTQSGTWDVTNISGTVSLPTGASTSAKQDTIIGHLDGVEGLLTTIDTDTGNIATSLAILDDWDESDRAKVNLIVGQAGITGGSGSVADNTPRVTLANDDSAVDSLNGIEGSTANIETTVTTISATPVLRIALFDDNDTQITSFGGGTQYTEDAAAAADPVGTALIMVRDDALSGQTSDDGDNVAARATDKGELYVKHNDAIPVTDNGGALTVDGTVSVTGVSTSAKQDTIIGHLDGVEGLLTTIDGDTGNISTKIDTLAGAVSGTEMQVDVLTMPTVTVNAHAVTNAGTFAVQVDGSALTALQLIDDTVYADDADWTDNTSKHLLVGGLYQATPQTVTDGDVAPFNITENGAMHVHIASGSASGVQYNDGDADADPDGTVAMGTDGSNIFALHTDTSGDLQVDVLSSALPSGAATSAKQDTIIGHLDGVEGLLTTIDGDTGNIVTSVQLIDDTVATLGTDTYTEATTKGLTIGAVRRDADTTLVNTTNEIGPLQMDANGRLKVEAFSGETLPVSLTSTTITGTVAVTQSGTWDEVGINDSGNSITVDNGGTFAVQVTSLPASTNTIEIVGDVAHDSGVGGNPVLNGAEARSSLGTSVSNGDVVRLAASRYGEMLTSAYVPSRVSSNGTPITATTTSVIAAPSASNHLRIKRFTVSNGGTTPTWVSLRDGAAGTQHYRVYLVQGSVVSINLDRSGPLDLTTATRLDIVLSAAGSIEYEVDYLTVAD